RTDRLLLTDLNQGFFLGKRELTAGVSFDAGDLAAVKNALVGGEKVADPKDPKKVESLDGLLEFNVYYGGKKVKPLDAPRSPSPGEKQKAVFTLKARERLGVVLRVNGLNTLGMEEGEREADQYSMWVLEPNVEYTIDGYYSWEARGAKRAPGQPKTFVHALEGLSSSESVLELGNNSKAGKIELIIFREVKGAALPKANRPPSLRLVTDRGKTLQDLRDHISKIASASVERTIRARKGGKEIAPITTVTFSGAIAGPRTITYFEAPK